jgi:hypothetical protein
MLSFAARLSSEGGLKPLRRTEFQVEMDLDRYVETYPELLASQGDTSHASQVPVFAAFPSQRK